MEHHEFYFLSADGLKLFGQFWKGNEKPKHIINLIHGMGEHSTRYNHWAERFVNRGFGVVAFDLRGHGKSEGKRGHAPNYEMLMKDIDLFFAQSANLFLNTPVILYGHSLGGNLAINYTLRRQPKVKALVATSPWLGLAFEPPAIKLLLAKTLNKIFPSMIQATELIATNLSHDMTEVNKYICDPLVHDKISMRMFVSIISSCKFALANAHLLKTPTLIVHGTGDKITSYKQSAKFIEQAGNIATLKLWDGLYHETHHELQCDEIFAYHLQWLTNILNI